MKHLFEIMFSIFLAAGLITMVACSKEYGKVSKEEKEKIQSVMKGFVRAKLLKNNNIYKIEDLDGVFDYLHDGVEKKEGLYVSCADVKVGADIYDIDYYIKEENGRYTVVKEVLHKKNDEKINKLIWKKD
jgi:ABC-type antimicrobial peptide transport system permease subunit